MWFEAFSLRHDCGVRFKVQQAHQWGGILRVQFYKNEDFYEVPLNKDLFVKVNGRWWSDWACNSEPYSGFKVIPRSTIRKELDAI